MKIKIVSTLLLSPLLLATCCSCSNGYTKTTINMSPEAAAVMDRIGYEMRKDLEPGGWEKLKAEIKKRTVDQCQPAMPTQQEGESLIKYSNYSAKWMNMDLVSSFTPKEGEIKNIILYIHGGAYMNGALASHTIYCDNLSHLCNALVIAPNYPLIPIFTYEEAYSMIDEVYNTLITFNKPITIAGDSSGGGLATGYTLFLKDNNKRLPNKVMLSSPWLDVNLDNKDIDNYANKDRLLAKYGLIDCGKMWVGEGKEALTKSYLISPIYGDFKNFPETLVYGSNCGIFYPDMIKFMDKLTQNNVKATFVEYNGFMHTPNLMYYIPEYQQGLDIAKNFIG